MKTIYLTLLLTAVISVAVFSKSINFSARFTNTSNESIRLGYVVGYTFTGSVNSPNTLGDIPANGSSDFLIQAQSGQSVFILVDLNNTWVETATIEVGNKKPNNVSRYINKPKAINSDNPVSNKGALEAMFSKVGEADITAGARNRFKAELSMANAMTTFCGALIIIDPANIKANGEFSQKDIENIIWSYYTNSAPLKLSISGRTIDDQIEYDNSNTVGTSASFPLAGNFDMNINGADYYKIRLQAKNAGWAVLEFANGTTYQERISALSDARKEAIAQMVMGTLAKCSACRVYPIEQVFYYESLTATTTKYNRLQGSVAATVSSVVTANGAYKRNEAQDLVSSRGSTIVYYGIGGDLTGPIASLSEGILKLATVAQKIGVEVPLMAVKSEVDKSVAAGITTESGGTTVTEVKEAKEYVDQSFLNSIQGLNTSQLKVLSTQIKSKMNIR